MRIDEVTTQNMKRAATKAAENAYAPYSRFPVGAAVLTADGEIFAGCNVENASYGLSICAERNAVFQAVAAGKPDVRAVVIVTQAENPTPPCGACRQVLSEFGRDVSVISYAKAARPLKAALGDLLPGAFSAEDLTKKRAIRRADG